MRLLSGIVAAVSIPLVAAGLSPAQTALYTFDGTAPTQLFGRALAGVGDVNGDGKDDLIVGAFLADPGGLADAGEAKVFSGGTGSELFTFSGTTPGQHLGTSVAGVGDVNGDGVPDVAVGDASSAKIFSVANGTLLLTLSPFSEYYGHALSGVGDVNGDGRADIIAGDFSADQARVFSGATGTVLFTFTGTIPGGNFGISTAGVGDVNGDSIPDCAVGAHVEDPFGLPNAGRVHVFSGAGGSLLYSLNPDGADDQFGVSVAGAGDVDGDGLADFIAGAWQPAGGLGYAKVFSGPDGAVLLTFNGTSGGHGFGLSVAGVGDVNGDSAPDFLVGARGPNPSDGVSAGVAMVFSGANGVALHTVSGTAGGDRFGEFVANAEDVNGDGVPDLGIGAPAADPFGLEDAGQVKVFSVTADIVTVAVDIKPGSFPNSVNLGAKGVIPVAILTTGSFNANGVNSLSVTFGPGGATEAHGIGHLEDVDGDGDLDLVLHFRTQQAGLAVGDTQACLAGQTMGGQAIQGCDSVTVVPR
ncbi:MAG TPA: FG-GAP-like repeat-containing protein [Planctomycetota bacterium]|jgi:hypothetical protein|nr:FG-GAP-like repeat-containing protein [Planctomycetota bacterium]